MSKQSKDKQIYNRIARIKGQINGLEQMIDKKRNCLEVLNQLAAIKAAISRLGLIIVESEASCLRMNKKDEKKLSAILNRFLKTS